MCAAVMACTAHLHLSAAVMLAIHIDNALALREVADPALDTTTQINSAHHVIVQRCSGCEPSCTLSIGICKFFCLVLRLLRHMC